MGRLLKHRLLLGLVTALAAISAGVAYAATQSGATSQQALINDVAKRLNVSPARLRSAVKGALLDRLQAAVKAGQLTQAQADKLKQRIESGRLPFGPFFGPPGFERRGPLGFGRHGPLGFGLPGPVPFGPKGLRVAPGTGRAFGPFAAAAKYLGMSQTQLLKDLRGGKSLAQVAKANGKSVSGLEQALTASLKTRLDRAVASGRLSKAQEQRMLKKLGAAMAGLANARGFQVPMAPLKPAQRPAPGPAVAPAPLGGPPPPSA